MSNWSVRSIWYAPACELVNAPDEDTIEMTPLISLIDIAGLVPNVTAVAIPDTFAIPLVLLIYNQLDPSFHPLFRPVEDIPTHVAIPELLRIPLNVVACKTPVLGLYVNPPLTSIGLLPVVADTNVG